MASRITAVELKDYRSIGSCKVELQPLTLLVGPNGSGKSNFLDALLFLAEAMHATVDEVVAKRSGIRSLLRKLPQGRSASSFSIGVNFTIEGIGDGTYSLMIGQGAEGGSVI